GGTGGGTSGTPTNVIWTKVVNAVATGASLKKVGGCDGCPDSGAVSRQRIAGDGYVEFTASEKGKLRVIGLTPTNFGTQAQTIPFAFALQPGGIAEIRESGVYRAETAFVPGDVLRIAVKSHVVKYFKNRVLI